MLPQKKAVLVIDDEQDFCALIKKNLEVSGAFEVTVCTDGTTAVQRAKQLQPNIILLDVIMPELSGPEIAEQIRASQETKHIPILFLTAIAETHETGQQNNRIGGEYVLAKPVSAAELIRMINLVTA